MTVQPISVSVTIGNWTGSVQVVGDPHDFGIINTLTRAVAETLIGWDPGD